MKTFGQTFVAALLAAVVLWVSWIAYQDHLHTEQMWAFLSAPKSPMASPVTVVGPQAEAPKK